VGIMAAQTITTGRSMKNAGRARAARLFLGLV
jgi:hypothetical protein